MAFKQWFKKNWFMILFFLIGIGAIVLILSQISIGEAIATFKNATPLLIIAYIIIQIAIVAILSFRWHLIIKSQGIKNIPFLNVMYYWICGWTIGFITPSAKLGGEPLRAGLLSKRHNVPFRKALSGVVIDKTLELSTSAFFFIVGGLIMLAGYVLSPVLRNFILGISAIFIVLLFLFNYQVMRGKRFFYFIFQWIGLFKLKRFQRMKSKIKDFENLIIKFYHKDRKHFFYTMIVSMFSWLIMFVEYKVAGWIVGVDLSLLHIFLVFSFVGAAYILPVPMGLGALEGGQVALFQAIKVSGPAGLAISLLVRVKDTIIALIGAVMLIFFGLRINEAVKDVGDINKDIDKVKDVDWNNGKAE